MIGKTLGSYKVVDELGAGGMGIVYVAEHPLLGKKAAVKLLLPQFSNNKELVDRFFNEARAATLVKHSGIVDVFDFGYTEDGSAYIVMEFLEGESLTGRIARGRSSEDEVIRLCRQVARALAAAHAAGIIHRDLKPDNIFLIPDGEIVGGERVKVLDFGIAKLSGEQRLGDSKTQTGQMMGSPLYMAPEQCRGAGEADARADVYSLGCIMYEMVCGRPVFDGTGVGDVIAKQIYETPEPPRQLHADTSEAIEAIILKTLAKEPGERFASMAELIDALDAASDGRFAVHTEPRVYGDDATAATVAPSEPPRPIEHTTLGTAAAEMTGHGRTEAPRSAKVAWGIGAAAALVLVAGGIVLAVGGGDSGDKEVAAPVEAAEPPIRSPRFDEPPPPEQAPPAPEKVTVVIESKPAGAAVYRLFDKRLLGETPFSQTVAAGPGKLALVLKLDGYKDQPVEVDLDKDQRVEFALSRKSRRPRSDRKPVAVKKPEVKPPPAKKPEVKPPEVKPPVKKPVVKPPELKKPKDKEWGKTYNPLDD